MKLDCYSTERGAVLGALTGYGKHKHISECNFFGFRGAEFLVDQTDRSAITSEADEDMLCLRATELRSGCVYVNMDVDTFVHIPRIAQITHHEQQRYRPTKWYHSYMKLKAAVYLLRCIVEWSSFVIG